MPDGKQKYMVTLMVDSSYNPQKYREFHADSDEEALEIGIRIANNYIRFGETPRLKHADVSKWVPNWDRGGWWSIDTEFKGRLVRGRELLREDVKSCSCCGGTGRIVPTK